MTVDPTKRHTLDSIYYHRDGRIDATDESIQHDMQTTLGLNNSRTNRRRQQPDCDTQGSALHSPQNQ